MKFSKYFLQILGMMFSTCWSSQRHACFALYTFEVLPIRSHSDKMANFVRTCMALKGGNAYIFPPRHPGSSAQCGETGASVLQKLHRMPPNTGDYSAAITGKIIDNILKIQSAAFLDLLKASQSCMPARSTTFCCCCILY